MLVWAFAAALNKQKQYRNGSFCNVVAEQTAEVSFGFNKHCYQCKEQKGIACVGNGNAVGV